MSEQKVRASWRNVIIFSGSVLLIGTFAGLNFHAMEGLGGLLFILSPLIVTIVMRSFAGDGWSDSGFRFGFSGNAKTYLSALVLFPLAFGVALTLGSLFGVAQFQSGWSEKLIVAVLLGALPVMIYAFSEEFAWRGYLEPKLVALGVSRKGRIALVGVVWGLWHVGYVLAQPDYTALPFALFLPLFMMAVFAMTAIYGVWREKTGSFWPAVLAHGVANTLAWPLLDVEVVQLSDTLVFAARPESLLVLVLLSGFALFATRKSPG